jgi:hypothetical protein
MSQLARLVAVGHLIDSYSEYRLLPTRPYGNTSKLKWPEIIQYADDTFALSVPGKWYHAARGCSLTFSEPVDDFWLQTPTSVTSSDLSNTDNYEQQLPEYQILWTMYNPNKTPVVRLLCNLSTVPDFDVQEREVFIQMVPHDPVRLPDYPIGSADNFKTVDFRFTYGTFGYFIDGEHVDLDENVSFPSTKIEKIVFGDDRAANYNEARYKHVLVSRDPVFGYKVATRPALEHSEFYNEIGESIDGMVLPAPVAPPTNMTVINCSKGRSSFIYDFDEEPLRELAYTQVSMVISHADKFKISAFANLRKHIMLENEFVFKGEGDHAFSAKTSLPIEQKDINKFEIGVKIDGNS